MGFCSWDISQTLLSCLYSQATVRLLPISTCHKLYTIQPLLAVHLFPQLSTYTLWRLWVVSTVQCSILNSSFCLDDGAPGHLLRKEPKASKKHLALSELLNTRQKYLTFISKVVINTEALSRPLPAFWCFPELLFTAPVFADRSDLAMLERIINMAYLDDRVGISSAFSLPKHYAIVAGGNWVAP